MPFVKFTIPVVPWDRAPQLKPCASMLERSPIGIVDLTADGTNALVLLERR